MSRYEYEYKQENYSMDEKRSSWSTTYPSYEEYHVPPPTIHKMVTHHPSYYETSDEEDDHDHDHDHMAVINGRWNRHDEDGSRGWDNRTRYANYNHVETKNKYKGGILRPPLGSESHIPSQQYRQHGGIDKVGQEVNYKNGWRYGEPASRINHHHHHNNNNNKNRVMEDYSRKYPSNYGKVSRMEDDDDHRHARIISSGGEELDSLIKKLQRAGMVKKIEVIEYERNIYKGAREEWRVVNGNGSGAPNNNNPFMAKTYPNYKPTYF